jgi:SAM-dependent methyltransferase
VYKTLDYYDNNAQKFVSGTLDVEFTDTQDKFLSYLPESGMILDYGCGSGRDTRYFLSNGYKVDAVDGSETLCKIAAENTGIKVRQMLFSQLDEHEKYDGIWACASILHLTKDELRTVLNKMIRAVKPNGYIYISFKYGEFEGYRAERYFTDFTENTFSSFLTAFSGIMLIEEWISSDVRPGRGDEKWLNIILQKSITG